MRMISWAFVPNGDVERGRFLTKFSRFEVNDELRLAKAIERTIWSPIVWKENIRGKLNFEFSDYCALDFESPFVALENIQREFCDSWHILATTRNHRRRKGAEAAIDRFRLVLKWERRIRCVQEYEYNVKRLALKYDADIKACDGGRLFFPSKLFSYEFGEDLYNESVQTIPDSEKDENISSAEEYYHKMGDLTPWTKLALEREVHSGSRNNTFFKVSCELARAGISQDEAERRILNSPTFFGKDYSHELARTVEQVKRTIKSAYQSNLKCAK